MKSKNSSLVIPTSTEWSPDFPFSLSEATANITAAVACNNQL